MIRFVLCCLFFAFGLFVFFTEVLGVFRFRFVLNRMHCAALGDTLGITSMAIGTIIYLGLSFASLKVILLLLCLGLTSPVSSHLVAKIGVKSDGKVREHVKYLYNTGKKGKEKGEEEL